MRPIGTMIAAACLVGGLAGGSACAFAGAASAPLEVRFLCNERGCWHTRVDRNRWYRPYGYYRPYAGPPGGPLGSGTFGMNPLGAGMY